MAFLTRPAILLWATALALALLAALAPPIAQPMEYHAFADRRVCFGLPNCLDTASNALFVLVGALGLRFLLGPAGRAVFIAPHERAPYLAFFAAVAAIGFASGYYHLAPDHAGLAWDRAAMALAFMAWLTAVLAERSGSAAVARLLPVFLAVGLSGVIWWYWSETQGRGDLRPYLLVQALPIVLTPLALRLYPPRYDGGGRILAIVGLYLVALLFDRADHAVFALTGETLSGHTLKHAIAACAAWQVLRYLKSRRRLAA